jgi:hypothetical protein
MLGMLIQDPIEASAYIEFMFFEESRRSEVLLFGFLGYVGEQLLRKIPLSSLVVKGEFASGNNLVFQAQIDDLRLKCCILAKNPKNKSSGRRTKPLRGGLV